MGRLTRRYKAAVLAVALVAAAPATAQAPELVPFNFALKYDVTWNNLPIGRIRITTTETEYRYTMQVDTKTRGIVRLFDSTKSLLKSEGRFTTETRNDPKPLPQTYESRSTDDDSTKLTTVRYNLQGEIMKRTRVPADDPANRPPVPLEQANDAVDPLTAMYMARQMLRDNIARNIRETTVRTYDGARLADFTFTVVSRAQLKIMDKHVNAINIVLKRKPIAGYKEKELKKFREGDPTIHVYFSADEKFIPLQADIDLRFGAISAKLASMTTKK